MRCVKGKQQQHGFSAVEAGGERRLRGFCTGPLERCLYTWAAALPGHTAQAPSETPSRFCEGIFLNKTPFPSLVQGAGSRPTGCSARLHPSVRTTQGSSSSFLSLVPTPERAHTEFIYFSFQTILFKQDLISLAHLSLLQAHKSLEFDTACNFLKDLFKSYWFGWGKPVWRVQLPARQGTWATEWPKHTAYTLCSCYVQDMGGPGLFWTS